MKKEIDINDLQLNDVVGGTVIISNDYMKVGFTTLGEMYDLQNCTYRDAMNYVTDLKAQANAQGMTNADFDVYCKNCLASMGWIK